MWVECDDLSLAYVWQGLMDDYEAFFCLFFVVLLNEFH